MKVNAILINEKYDGELFPVYANDKEMMIGGWSEPINTLADYQFAKEMGLNLILIEGRYAKNGTREFEEVLRYCEQVGLDVFITVGNALHTEFAKERWSADSTDYSRFPAVKAINYWDEPWRKNFDRVAELIDEHMEKYGDKIDVFINHFPNTAVGAFGGLTYEEFISEYVDKILLKSKEGHRYLSADIYPLELRNGESFVRTNWLGCIETIALQGKRANALTHFFIQTTEHRGDEQIYYRAITEKDLRWQIFVNFAFGIQAYSFFTYSDSFCKGFSNSCVRKDVSCSTHNQYYWAQTVNRETAAFDHVYLSFEWKGTLPVIGTENTTGINENFNGLSYSVKKIDCLKEVTASQDALIGQFKDKDGNDGLIITNFTDPALELENKIVITFENADKARVYYKGEYKDYSIINNQMEFTLDAGDGVFVIPTRA